MKKASKPRRTQAERREQSRQAVLQSACRLFGEKGYAGTSLEDIAADCELTIRPIYHYFGNKKALFAAVTAHMSERIIDTMVADKEMDPGLALKKSWRGFLDLCDDPGFRRVVLVDSPNILGRERWSSTPVYLHARDLANTAKTPRSAAGKFRAALLNSVMMGAMAEAALLVAEADNVPMAKREAEHLILKMFSRLEDYG